MSNNDITILVVEDKESMAEMLKEALESEGYGVLLAGNAQAGIKIIGLDRIDLVLTDLKLPDQDGMSVLNAVKEQSPLTPVIIMTAFGSIETAVSAIKEGAFDFITKPFDIDHLIVLVRRALENRRLVTENLLLKDAMMPLLEAPDIIGKSKAIREVARQIQKVAPAKTTVLITGESGTGKELFARAIHYLSPRKGFPFVPINCAAIPSGLLESELFGYEKGAFTGAESRKLGKFELADRGTVFLDEIGDLDISLQGKLLRVIQDGEVEHVGATKSVKTDVRIIAATNKDLELAVSERRFRDDLYYRLSVFPIIIPPLRERAEDIPLMVDFFLAKFGPEMNARNLQISPTALDMLMQYPWKGNVRELENTIERAIILRDGNTILTEHISLRPLSFGPSAGYASGSLEETSKKAIRQSETERIRIALKACGGNKTKTAESLKVSYKTLLTKIKEYGLDQ